MDIDGFRISEMTEADLKDVVRIENLSFSLPWKEEMFKAELSLDCAHDFTGRLSLNGSRDMLVAYICGWLFHGEAHILNIAIHPDYRRMGLGNEMMQFFCDYCRAKKVKTLTLDVRRSNKSAIKMYRKMGFRRLGLRHHYYGDNGEDALILGLELNRK